MKKTNPNLANKVMDVAGEHLAEHSNNPFESRSMSKKSETATDARKRIARMTPSESKSKKSETEVKEFSAVEWDCYNAEDWDDDTDPLFRNIIIDGASMDVIGDRAGACICSMSQSWVLAKEWTQDEARTYLESMPSKIDASWLLTHGFCQDA